MDKQYTFEDLIGIIASLRGEHGCPWDKKQTHASLRTCMIEEAYEVLEGIRLLEKTGLSENLCEELGDVLLQVMLHSQIAKEEGIFTIDDVIHGISEKMIRRHPHVFGECVVNDAKSVVDNWEELKKKEKKYTQTSDLESVPKSFPALIRASKILKKMESEKRQFTEVSDSFQKAQDLLSDMENGEVSKEMMGQLLLEICNISRKHQIHAEEALYDEVEKVIRM